MLTKRRRFSLLLVVLAASAAIRGGDPARAEDAITIGFSDSPPISVRDQSGAIKGFAVEVFRAAADKAGVSGYKQDLVSFGDLLSGLTARRFDVVVMSPTPERRKSAIFTEPLAANGETLIVRADDPTDYTSIAQLQGKTVGSNAGGGWIAAVQAAGGTIKTYPAAEQTLAALEAGEVQAIVGNAPTYRYLLKTGSHGRVRIAANYKAVQVNELSFAIRPQDTTLRDRLDGAMRDLRGSGVLARMRTEWGF